MSVKETEAAQQDFINALHDLGYKGALEALIFALTVDAELSETPQAANLIAAAQSLQWHVMPYLEN